MVKNKCGEIGKRSERAVQAKGKAQARGGTEPCSGSQLPRRGQRSLRLGHMVPVCGTQPRRRVCGQPAPAAPTLTSGCRVWCKKTPRTSDVIRLQPSGGTTLPPLLSLAKPALEAGLSDLC